MATGTELVPIWHFCRREQELPASVIAVLIGDPYATDDPNGANLWVEPQGSEIDCFGVQFYLFSFEVFSFEKNNCRLRKFKIYKAKRLQGCSRQASHCRETRIVAFFQHVLIAREIFSIIGNPAASQNSARLGLKRITDLTCCLFKALTLTLELWF